MAEFQLDIVNGGTLNLADGSRLPYSEAHVLQHTAQGILYQASSDKQYAVFIPHMLDDQATQAWFEQTLHTYQTIQDNGQTNILPRLALARHSVFGCLVWVVNAPTQSLSSAIQVWDKQGQIVKAERLALSAFIPYLTLLDTLVQQGKSLTSQLDDFRLAPDAVGNLQPTLFCWSSPQSASAVAPIHGVLHVGGLLCEALLGNTPRLPFAPFDDSMWQTRGQAFQSEGMISMGLRVILTALFHAPIEKRFTYEGQPSFLPFREALREWYRLVHQLGSVVDSQTSNSLANLSALLPEHHQFTPTSPIAQAIFEDLWWRVHLGDTLPQHVLLYRDSLRTEAIAQVKAQQPVGYDFVDSLRAYLPNNDTSTVRDFVSVTRETVQNHAQNQDITQWALWQHLGRWQRLLSINTAREIVTHIGFTLHRHPSEDTPQTLDIIENTLVELGAEDILAEVRLRQSACLHRQNGDWRTRYDRYQQFRHASHQPDYLTLPHPTRDDFTVRPFTLLGQIIGQYTETVQQLVEAIEVGNVSLATAVLEFADVLPVTTQESQQIQNELASYRALLKFVQTEQTQTDILQHFRIGAMVLNFPPIAGNGRLRELLERKLLAISQQAYESVQHAVENKTWEVIRGAYSAFRLLTERDSRHLIEQLRLATHDTPRSIAMSSTLSVYERIFNTYQLLFTAVKDHHLWQATHDTLPKDQQDRAKQILNMLQEAQALGIPMNDVVSYDEATRQQWQQMLTDALSTLQRVESVTDEVEQLRQHIHSEVGLAGQIQGLVANLNALQAQIDGNEGDKPSLIAQMKQLRAQLGDMEKIYQGQLEQNRRDISVMQDDVQRQLETHDIAIQRHTQQISSTGNLVENARERLLLIENELLQIQKHEAQMLCTYLDAMPSPSRMERINAVLDAVDGLMYALRRCPVEAYDEGCHASWMTQFKELKNRFEMLANSKLSWRDRRNLKNNLRQIRALFTECEAEASTKSEANKMIFTKPAM
jgi:hypothetical protein